MVFSIHYPIFQEIFIDQFSVNINRLFNTKFYLKVTKTFGLQIATNVFLNSILWNLNI